MCVVSVPRLVVRSQQLVLSLLSFSLALSSRVSAFSLEPSWFLEEVLSPAIRSYRALLNGGTTRIARISRAAVRRRGSRIRIVSLKTSS